jgi:hypothetical protein
MYKLILESHVIFLRVLFGWKGWGYLSMNGIYK